VSPELSGQRFGLAAVAVQRQHELSPQPLAQRVLLHRRLEVRDETRVPAEGELGLHAELDSRHAKFLQARDRDLREARVPQVRERGPSPQRKRRAQPAGRTRRVTPFERALAVFKQALEAPEIELIGRQPQDLSPAPP
jgi:hypothetical protein